MDTYLEFCIRFWEATRELDLYSMDGSQLDRLIIDALSKTNGGGELIKTSMNDLSVLISAFNHNNRKIQSPSIPSNVDEAAANYTDSSEWLPGENLGHIDDAFKAGAEWMAGQGWIDDGSMPPETKQESDTLQGHREWTESEPVLAWDSTYGCRVDWTRNGKWMSEQTGGYTGQVCHGIIAWRPIPKYKEKH